MILFLHLLLTVLTTVLYVLFGNAPAGFAGVAATAGVFLGALVFWIVLMLGFLLFVMIGFKMADPRKMFKHRLLIAFCKYFYLTVLRVRLVVTGRENLPANDNFVMFSNHIEASDPMYIKMVYGKHPLAFVSKEVLFKQFVVGSILTSVGNIPISPGADRSALLSIIEGIKRVQGGQPFGIFPEGKRTYSNDIIAFRPGAFKLATKAQADISTVCVYGMHEINRKGRILPVTVYLHVFPLIKAESYVGLDTVDLAKQVETLVRDKMEAFKLLYPEPVKKA